MKKNIYLLLFLLFCFGLINVQARTLNTNDAVGTLPGAFHVNTNGAATYYIPIKLTKGRAGFTPTLGLSYNSQRKNSILGMGWGLSGLSSISRTGTNLYNDDSMSAIHFGTGSKFALDGQLLVPINSTVRTEYRIERETFSKIIVHGSDVNNPDWFEVRTKDGRIIEYGNGNNSAMSPNGIASKLLWRINRVGDREGNYIDYYYSSDKDPGEITKITYTGNLNNGATPAYEVDFTYSGRNDADTMYVSGGSYYQNHLLSTITVKYNGTTVESYQIAYDQTAMYPRIVSISTTDANGNTMNPTVFSYGTAQSGFTTSATNIYKSGEDVTYITGDFNGDGKTDIACAYYTLVNGNPVYNSWSVFYSTGGSTFTETDEGSLSGDFVKFVSGDFNGDGKCDLVAIDSVSADTFYLSNGNSFTPVSAYNNIAGETGSGHIEYKAVDLNGDGKDELMVADLVDGETTIWDYQLNSNNVPISIFNNGSVSIPRDNTNPILIGDFEGSGKTDLLDIRATGYSFLYKYNKAEGKLDLLNYYGYLISPNYYPGSSLTGDFNGDGNTDILVRTSSDQWTVKYFNGKTGWVAGPSITYPHSLDLSYRYEDFHFTLSDFNGDGKTDILFSYKEYYYNSPPPGGLTVQPLSGSTRQFVQKHWDAYYSRGNGFKEERFTTTSSTTVDGNPPKHFDSNGDGKDECLIGTSADGTALQLGFFHKDEDIYSIQQISNGLGRNINITYANLPQTSAYTKDSSAQYPLIDLDFPLTVVTKTQAANGLGGYFEKDYAYEGLIGNQLGIPGPGFQKLTVTDHVSNSQTVTQFRVVDDNGHYYFEYPWHTTQYALNSDGTVSSNKIRETTNTIEIKNTVAGNPWIYYPVLTQSVTKWWDNGSPNTFIKMKTDTQPLDKIDDWGNSLEHTVTISKDEQGTVYATSTYESSYSQNMDTTDWIIDRPDYTIVTNHYVNNSKNSTVRTNYTYYALGQQSWPLVSNIEVIPNNDTKYRNEIVLKYDIYGHITKKTISAPDLSVPSNPPLISRVTDYEYDESNGNDGRFLTAVTKYNRSTSFTSTFQYNLSDGTLSKSTNADGLSINYEYGPFGEVIKVVNPDGSSTSSQLHWANWSSISSMAPQNAVYALCTTSANHSRQVVFYDKLGRALRTMTTGLTTDQWIGMDKVYVSRGFLKMVSQPYFSGNAPNQSDMSQWTVYNRNTLNNKITGITSPANTVTYSQSGLQVSTTNQATGLTRTTTLDPLGRKLSVTDPTGTISYQYYSNGKLKSTNANGSVTTLTYDDAGRRQKVVSPNSGTTHYLFSNFGELLSQTDTSGNNYKMIYDELGRIKTKTLINTSAVTTYTYNDVPGTDGFGAIESVRGPGNITYQYTYDVYNRLKTKSETIDGSAYTSQYTYDSIGELQQKTYPSGYSVQYVYSNSGALSEVKDGSSGTVLWQANAISRRGQLTSYSLGNGLTTLKQFNDITGFPESIITQNSTGYKVQDLAYSFNNATGDLTSRTDNLYNLTENFGYDNVLHSRLTSWQVVGQTGYSTTWADNGNMLTKSDVTSGNGQYVYGNTGNPYAVQQITQPVTAFKQNASRQYITYTAFHKMSTIQQTDTINGQTHTYQYSLKYGPDFFRKKSVFMRDSVTQDTKYYIGGDYEVKIDAHGHQRKMNYLYGGDGLFAIYVQNNGADTMYYIQKNYLGSYYCVTDASGKIATLDGQKQVYSFGPWGRRRNATTWTYNNVPQTFLFDRGFTGQEHLDAFGLINLNGRSYDPWLGRFLSVDPIIDDLSNTQRFNSYTYANNNPMRFVDPTGYDGFSDVYLGPGMRAWIKPEQDGPGGGGGDSDNGGFHYSYTDHAYEDANGNIVGWDYVYASYVAPNAISIFNSNSANGIISMSINISDNSVEIKMEYLESWSSMTNSAGQHVGFDDISIGGQSGGGINMINNISNAASFTTNAIKYTLQYTKVGGNVGYSLSYSKAFLRGVKSLKTVGNVASMFTTGFAYYKIANGTQQPVTYLDATVGTVGLSAQIASYYSGIEIPYVGEFVAIYGTLRLFYDLGQTYGPSTWYGKNDYKWFE